MQGETEKAEGEDNTRKQPLSFGLECFLRIKRVLRVRGRKQMELHGVPGSAKENW